MSSPTRSKLMELVVTTNRMMESLRQYDIRTQHWDPLVVATIEKKLDKQTLDLWIMERPQKVIAKLKPLIEFIMKRADGMGCRTETSYASRSAQSDSQPSTSQNYQSRSADNRFKSRSKERRSSSTSSIAGKRRKQKKLPDCTLCPQKHRLWMCDTFKSLPVPDRKMMVRRNNICDRCLEKHVGDKTCHMKPCSTCREMHNTLLCETRVAPTVHLASISDTPASPDHPQMTLEEVLESEAAAVATLLPTALVSSRSKTGRRETLRALCDPCSQLNFVTTDSIQKLRLIKHPTNMVVSVMGSDKLVESKGIVKLTITSLIDETKSYVIQAHVLRKITSKVPLYDVDCSSWEHIQGLQLADPTFNVSGDIQLLLNSHVWGLFACNHVVKGNMTQPTAQSTSLGFIVFGGTEQASALTASTNAAMCHRESSAEVGAGEEPEWSANMSKFVQRFWSIEDVEEIPINEEDICEEHFTKHVSRESDGRYVVRIPLLDDALILGESRNIAVQRLFQMETRFAKNNQLKTDYQKCMSEYEQLGHMVEVARMNSDESQYYIPHHAAGTKEFRVVFDGSCPTSTGVSFNDQQLNGTRLQKDIADILLHFRQGKIALKADIKKMYRQVKVPADQHNMQRIVWRT